MYEGTVKWFNDKKGFGFINSPEVSGDVFAHYSQIQTKGFKTLKEGQKVRFDVENDHKGTKATNIKPM